ncbi:hypothetical protein C8R44DRAFT_639957 [Mycena epipterygia]|nr:hypothetical protein C8R44DRAFT_639957 [Mycena epipterygia]
MSLLSSLLKNHVLKSLGLPHIVKFIQILALLKDNIILVQPISITIMEAPLVLPPQIKGFVAKCIGILEDSVSGCWTALKDDIWEYPTPEKVEAEEEELFARYGWKRGIICTPPTHLCDNLACLRTNPLKKAECRQVVVYTLARGVQPAWSIHLYCEDCKTNYQYKFSVNQGIRTYYGGIPKYIQVGEHQFVKRKLVGMWISLMLMAWVSATNCARSYDMALSEGQEHDLAVGGWQFGSCLTTDHVWDAFIVLTLLDHSERNGVCLAVPHTGAQKDRFTAAMRARNLEVIQEGPV